MSNRTIALTDELHEYMLSVSLREPEILSRLRRETSSHPRSSMQISPEQGQFMGFLVKLLGARKALELGVFTGYSSLCVALALPADGKLIACDLSEEYTQTARRYWIEAGVEEKIELRLGPALDSMDDLLSAGEAETFDFVFIDADKEEYEAYYERALRLLRPAGLITVDNIFWSGRVLDPKIRDRETRAIRAFNEKLCRDERIDVSLVPIGDGLTLARKRPNKSIEGHDRKKKKRY
jgi:caffeoyl-CoA O-methyltransferase